MDLAKFDLQAAAEEALQRFSTTLADDFHLLECLRRSRNTNNNANDTNSVAPAELVANKDGEGGRSSGGTTATGAARAGASDGDNDNDDDDDDELRLLHADLAFYNVTGLDPQVSSSRRPTMLVCGSCV